MHGMLYNSSYNISNSVPSHIINPMIGNSYEWTTAKTEKLINQYRSFPELWDVTCPSYRNRWKKKRAWKLLAEQLNTGELETRRKMHNLRSQLSHEIRRDKSSWYFLPFIEFLRTSNNSGTSHVCHSKTSNFSDMEQESSFDHLSEDSQCSDCNNSIPFNENDQTWSQKCTEELIAQYKTYTQLWNRADSNYRSKSKRKDAIESMAQYFNVLPSEIMRKIHNLRSQYCHEQKKSLKNNYESSWHYLPHLKFLDQHLPVYSQESLMCNSSINLYSENDHEDVYKLLHQLNGDEILSGNSCRTELQKDRRNQDAEFNQRVNIMEHLNQNKKMDPGIKTCYVWTIDTTSKLIHAFQSYPELWDTNCPNYRDKSKKKIAYDNIARQFSVDKEEIYRKLHNLRSQFNQEFRKVHTKPNFETSWCFYSSMMFLKENNSKTRGGSVCYSQQEVKQESTCTGLELGHEQHLKEDDSQNAVLNDSFLEPIVHLHTIMDQSEPTTEATHHWLNELEPKEPTNHIINSSIKTEPTNQSNQSTSGTPSLLDLQNIPMDHAPSVPPEGDEEGCSSTEIWTIRRTRELIGKYEESRELWDISCPAYRNRWKKRRSWYQLAASLRVTKDEVQRKMHNLRSQFCQELRRVHSKPNYQSSWVFFSSMMFTKNISYRHLRTPLRE